jgi:hypothetical protein
MIKSNELRRGNLVNRRYWNPHPRTPSYCFDDCVVEIIKPELVNLRLKDNSIIKNYPLEHVSPIELSPSILENAGFKKKGDDDHLWIYKDTAICCYFDGVEFCFKYGHDAELVFAACEFLHQAQNLIFSLTGSELPINLTSTDKTPETEHQFSEDHLN